MNTSNQVMKTFFVIVGILAVIALIIFASFKLLSSPDSREDRNKEEVSEEPQKVEDSNPLLSESQESSLENLGFDPSDFPSEITPAMQVCFVEKLGAERAQEIKDGDSPTATDYLKAKSCLSVE